MNLEDFKSGFKSFTISYTKKGWKSSFIEKRSSVSKRLYKFNFVVNSEAPPAKGPTEGTVLAQIKSAPSTMEILKANLELLSEQIEDNESLQLGLEDDDQQIEPSNEVLTQGNKIEAYIGAELYNKRMYPSGCPSYQKAFVKLYKVSKLSHGRSMKLIATHFFSNRDGFGYINRNLEPGEYQLQFKKYSQSFDVFDFTMKVYSSIEVKFEDEDDSQTKKIQLTPEQLKKLPKLDSTSEKENAPAKN